MSRNFALLNDRCNDYNTEINSLKEKIKESQSQQAFYQTIISNLTNQLAIEQSKPPFVVFVPAMSQSQSQRPLEFLIPRIFFHPSKFIYSLPNLLKSPKQFSFNIPSNPKIFSPIYICKKEKQMPKN